MIERPDLWLQGWRIVVLRPQLDVAFKEMIQGNGGVISHLPMFSIDPLEISAVELGKWQALLKQASYLLIASQNAVSAAPAALLQTIANVSDLKIITMGETTTLAARHAGLSVYYTPPPGTTSEILLSKAFLQASAVQGTTIVLLAGEDGRSLLADTLASRGAKIQWCKVYRQEKIYYDLDPVFKTWQQANKNCFIATSCNMLENLLTQATENEKAWILQQPFIVVSERIAQLAKKYGIHHLFMANGAELPALAQALQAMCEVCNTAK